MVGRVAWAREAVEVDDARSGNADVLLGNRHERPPQPLELIQEDPPSAAFQPARVDEVRRADLGDVHGQSRVLPHEHPRGARVIEVDVRQKEMAQIGRGDAVLPETGPEGVDRRRRAAVEQRRPVGGVEQVGADDTLGTEME